MKAKQKKLLKCLKESKCIITAACERANVARRTYYNWMDNDEDFRHAVEDLNEEILDIVESKLLTEINEGNLTATIFYLKTKGKKRGYVETVEQKVTVNPFEEMMKNLPDDPE